MRQREPERRCEAERAVLTDGFLRNGRDEPDTGPCPQKLPARVDARRALTKRQRWINRRVEVTLGLLCVERSPLNFVASRVCEMLSSGID